MLEGKLEKLHCGSMCFAVYGKREIVSDFIEYLIASVSDKIEVRTIAGRDHLDRFKIVITGNIVTRLSIDEFRRQLIDDYCNR
ncbi:hypothetical protein GVv1_47730 (plasmid) [Enterobacter pseudoroggenkampii]